MSLPRKPARLGTSVVRGIHPRFPYPAGRWGDRGFRAEFVRRIYSNLPFPGLCRPVFIVGCGRSGTTILGTALSKHQEVTYLNEPLHLWFSAYPETDIWTPRASSRKGKLFLTELDVALGRSNKLSRLFRFETILSGRPVLIEKLPINCFRLNFIHHIFPDALFIHIFRNGLEVASSIEKLAVQGLWFGSNFYKWTKLVEYAMCRDDTKRLPALCTTHFDKGLLEWRLSTEAVVVFLRRLPDDAFIEVNYDELVDRPVDTGSQILNFVGVEGDPKIMTFLSDTIKRASRKLDKREVSKAEQIIGGDLLPLSMDGGKGLIRRCT